MKNKTILVTGGAGYIGSFTVRELLDQEYNVVILDSLENGHREAVDPRAILEVTDLSDKKATAKCFDKYKPEAIIDFAAYLSVGESMQNPEKYLKNNVENFIKLLDVMVDQKCNYIIKSSTASTYGDPQKSSDLPLKEDYQEHYRPKSSSLLLGLWKDEDVVGEKFLQKIIGWYDKKFGDRSELKLSNADITKLRIPTSVYGVSKLLDEIILEKYNISSGIKYIALRYFNVCGGSENGDLGEDHPEETHIIPVVMKNILNGKEFTLNGGDYNTKDGTTGRDYIHVIDLAQGHVLALDYLLKTNKSNTFNLGRGEEYTVKEIIDSIEKHLGKKACYKVGPRRSGDPEILIASPTKAENELKWKAKYNLEDMVRTAWKWHQSHPKGYYS